MCLLAYAVACRVFQIGKVFAGGVSVIGLIIALVLLAFLIYQLFRPYRESQKLEIRQ
jgi:ferrous iron transport protein B